MCMQALFDFLFIFFNFVQDLQAIFTREGILRKTVHSVWGCPGHLFVALEGGELVRAYQVEYSVEENMIH